MVVARSSAGGSFPALAPASGPRPCRPVRGTGRGGEADRPAFAPGHHGRDVE
ncbi:Hypothetical protein SLIV_36933 [Streptomyces lividans TK24]|uniref:Uncharacterized protein n=1 Tax=Streptomyces lividans TK24 TaxID=457428 RepID=A0ABX6TRE4_STRLI|nr:Hypothetical protein SLIV_36933 [Streptomyces lividans TK24]QSJ13880.1 Hypothetical protein SLIVDG2_36933 [Streptomyces lividans]QTD74790.1 Hypothetical protein SLIVYQS_36933 [Streptomyces lividans TK24] [Streptomyces lividans]